MRYIDMSIIDKDDPDVAKWIKKAKGRMRTLAQKQTHQERVAYFNSSPFWKEFKPILIRYYGEKCWYSECDLTGSFGDVDHFRPKSRSTDQDGRVIVEEGYWWLAFDYLNYRLSCEKCNRSFRNGGKNDSFPLRPGTVPAERPKKNDEPILLDPCCLEDTELIDCDEAGKIIAISADEYDQYRVEISSRVYNWDCFNIARKKVRTRCKTELETFEYLYEIGSDGIRLPIEQLKRLTSSDSPYSSFAKKYIAKKIKGKSFEEVLSVIL